MATTSQLRTARATAGAAIVRAAKTYVNTLRRTCSARQALSTVNATPQLDFRKPAAIVEHGEFLRDIPAIVGGTAGRIATRRNSLIES